MDIKFGEVNFQTSRSHKPGGTNRDHRSTKVHLWIRISDLPLEESEKKTIRRKLAHHINRKDELWLENQETRSQEMNKHKAMEHLNVLISEALKKPASRIPTKPSLYTENSRIAGKKHHGAAKKNRRTGKASKI